MPRLPLRALVGPPGHRDRRRHPGHRRTGPAAEEHLVPARLHPQVRPAAGHGPQQRLRAARRALTPLGSSPDSSMTGACARDCRGVIVAIASDDQDIRPIVRDPRHRFPSLLYHHLHAWSAMRTAHRRLVVTMRSALDLRILSVRPRHANRTGFADSAQPRQIPNNRLHSMESYGQLSATDEPAANAAIWRGLSQAMASD